MAQVSTIIKIVAVNVTLLLIGTLVVEIMFGTWFSPTHALYQFTKPRSISLLRKNPISNEPPMVQYTRDHNGFRGLGAPVSEIDLITVGGSTTDQRWIDDAETYQAVLQSLFAKEGRTKVIANAGIDGQSTIGHINNFTSWFNHVEGLKAKYILFYVGINDVLTEGDDAYDSISAKTSLLRLQLWVREKSALYQLYLIAKYAIFPDGRSHVFDRKSLAVGERLASVGLVTDYNLVPFVTSLEVLGRRINRLVELTRAMGAEPIFVTQRSARWNNLDGRIVGITDYGPDAQSEVLFKTFGKINGVDIYNIERKIAEQIMTTCRRAKAVCLDLAGELNFDIARDFYDQFHTTRTGARLIGEYLFRRLNGVL